MRTRPFLPLLLIATATTVACGPAETESGDHITVAQQIQGGEVDDNHPAVVGLVTTSGYGIGTCSGTLIAPNLVLTAQHCVAEIGSEYIICGRTSFGSTRSPRGVYVTTNQYLTNDARNYHEVAEIVTADKDDVCGNDIALMILATNVPETEATPMVPRIDLPVWKGEEYAAIGYGHTGNGGGSGVRRILDGRLVQCEGLNCPGYAQVEAAEFLGSSGTCQGDSGGPAIDYKGRVLGALSRGAGQCESSTYSAVAGWGEWIMEHGLLAAERGGYEAPFWAVHGISEIPIDDLDLDGVLEGSDNCADVANEDQADVDDDGNGDACDDDSDNDAILDASDNCLLVSNPEQLDFDANGLGDLCDDDDDGDGVNDGADFCPLNPRLADFGSNCSITGDDLIVVTNTEKQGCSTTGGAPSSLAGLALMLGLFWRPRRRR